MGQAFEPDALILRGSGVRLESLTVSPEGTLEIGHIFVKYAHGG